MSTQPAATSAQRYYFLDWVRIIAFFLLIFYHVGMYYVTWDWHVKSPFASGTIEPLMMLTSPWRLGLLFLVSGVASGMMLMKDKNGFFGRRSVRLLVPLLFGMFVIVPPQAYYEVVEKLAYAGGYAEFMKLYVAGYHGFCKADVCLDLPTWNHLWFVAYLWLYTVIIALLYRAKNSRYSMAFDYFVDALYGWRLILLPAAWLALLRIFLFDAWPPKNNLTGDWYNHALYLSLFLFGVLVAPRARFWREVSLVRWRALPIALVGWCALVVYFSAYAGDIEPPQSLRLAMRVVYCLTAWSAMLATTGFASLWLHQDSRARRYLTDAIFPVYILHQTLIVCFAHWVKPVGLNPVVEGFMLIVLTLAVSFLGYEIVRRVFFLRPLFGLAGKIKLKKGTPEERATAR